MNAKSLIVKIAIKKAKPFLKWAGGKTQLLPEINKYYPLSYNTYFEPFVGSGAVFFDLNPKKGHINDINGALIGTYKNLRDRPDEVINILRHLNKDYKSTKTEEAKRDFYNQIRAEYNQYNVIKEGTPLKSAYLIFLNKTCFNGIYRENSSGGFNVPFGKNMNPPILDEDNLMLVSEALHKCEITQSSFEEVLKKTRKGDFVYMDPPYDPVSKTSSFTSYSKNGFGKTDQEKLFDNISKLVEKGCKILISNSDTPYTNRIYSQNLHLNVKKVYARRSINSQGGGRKPVRELIVYNNYETRIATS